MLMFFNGVCMSVITAVQQTALEIGQKASVTFISHPVPSVFCEPVEYKSVQRYV